MTANFELAKMDCVEWLSSIEDETVDLCVLDSAYQSLERHRATGTTTRLTADWFDIFPNKRQPDLLTELYRVLKKNTHCYLYCDQETAHVLHRILFEFDLNAPGSSDPFRHTALARERFPFAWKKALIWMKSKAELDGNGEAVPAAGMGYSYRYAHECIVYLEKGKRRLNDLGMCDVLAAPRIRNGYPTEKNVLVTSKLIMQSSESGELVIDPFLGSGSTGDSALVLGRRFAGCDTSEKSIELARDRCVYARTRGFEAGRCNTGGLMLEGQVITKRLPPTQASLFGV